MYKTATFHSPRPRAPAASNKRKERDTFEPLKPPPFTKLPRPPPSPAQAGSSASRKAAAQPARSSQLLAGYLAHEYLTKGTLFGQPWDSARAEPVLPGQRWAPVEPLRRAAEPNPDPEPEGEKRKRYVEVATLLKTDGAHLPNIVNPAQLARFLRTK